MSFILPELFTIDKLGKERFWRIRVQGNVAKWESGIVGGKAVPYERKFEGVNVGKSNETSANEQAKRAAETMWVKQISSGYKPKCKEGIKMAEKVNAVTSKNGGRNTGASAAIRGREGTKTSTTKNHVVSDAGTIIPMSAMALKLQSPGVISKTSLKYFDFERGVYLQYKLDGWRCVVRVVNGKVVLTTRNGKQYPWFSSLREVLKKFEGKDYLDGIDGELYAHTLVDKNGNELGKDDRFSMISSMCGLARTNPHELEDQICLYAFDLVDLSGKIPFEDRFKKLKTLIQTSDRIVLCNTKLVHKPEEIFSYHDFAAQQGYEGCMIRASDGKYSATRSQYLAKYKQFIDEEFEVCGVECDDGVGKENFSFILKHKNKTFKAKPVGSVNERLKMFANAKFYKGKMMTVKFQEYSGDGIPRFPVSRGVVREDL